jgi:hypothetical protein
MVRDHCRPPRATDRHAPSPPSTASTRTRPHQPPFFLSAPCHRASFSKALATTPLPSFLRPSPKLEHRHPLCLRYKLVRPFLGTGRCATPPVWEPPLPPPRPHGELCLPVFFCPNFLRSSLPLRLPVLWVPATTFADHRSSSLTPGMPLSRATSASPLSHRRLGASPLVPPCLAFSPFHT